MEQTTTLHIFSDPFLVALYEFAFDFLERVDMFDPKGATFPEGAVVHHEPECQRREQWFCLCALVELPEVLEAFAWASPVENAHAHAVRLVVTHWHKQYQKLQGRSTSEDPTPSEMLTQATPELERILSAPLLALEMTDLHFREEGEQSPLRQYTGRAVSDLLSSFMELTEKFGEAEREILQVLLSDRRGEASTMTLEEVISTVRYL